MASPATAQAVPTVDRSPSVQALKPSSIASISNDGRTAVLIRDEGYPQNSPPYNNGFIRDLWCHTTITIPRHSIGAVTPQVLVDGFDERVAATPDGRYIAFSAWLTVPRFDLAVYDRRTGTVTEASAGLVSARSSNPSLSADGRYVAFDSYDGAVYVRDLRRGTIVRVDRAQDGDPSTGLSARPNLNATGRFVAFTSDATDLVAGDTNGVTDVFVRDLRTGVTSRVSISASGAQADGGSGSHPMLSANGRYVAFVSAADNLVAGDTNGVEDVFVHDRWRGTTRRVSTGAGGRQGNGPATEFSVSADGLTVAFTSDADNLVAGDTNGQPDVFVAALSRGTVRRASLARGGAQLDNWSAGPTLSASGRYLGFNTPAQGVPQDTNGLRDGYVRDLRTNTVTRATLYAPATG